jgi:hypothetical protein
VAKSESHIGEKTNAKTVPAWVNGLPLQAKLTINQPGDPYEQEADAVAEQVMRMPAGATSQRLQRCACGGAAGPDGECEACKARRLALQCTGDSVGGSEVPPSVHQTLNRPGQSLDDSTRDFMESRFGADFSGVRVHSDSQAAQSAWDVAARAYTVGNDVVFGAGQYAPGTEAGRGLLAHELTHVVQQGNGQLHLSRALFEVGSAKVNIDYRNIVYTLVDQYQNKIESSYASYTGNPASDIQADIAKLSVKQREWLCFALDLLMDNPTADLDRSAAARNLVKYASSSTTRPLGAASGPPDWPFENEVLRVSGWFEKALTQSLKPPKGEGLAFIHDALNPGTVATGSSTCPAPRPPNRQLDKKLIQADLPRLMGKYLESQYDKINSLKPVTQSIAPIYKISDLVQAEAKVFFAPYIGHTRTYDFMKNWQYSTNLVQTNPAADASDDLRLDFLRNRALDKGSGILKQARFDSRCDADSQELEQILIDLDKDSNVRKMLKTILSWQNYTNAKETSATVTINLQYAPSQRTACEARWRMIETLCHELLHVLVHPDFRQRQEGRQILAEGFAEILGDQLYRAIARKASRDKVFRGRFEAGLSSTPCDSIPDATIGYNEAGQGAHLILAVVDNDNYRAAYFLGQTHLIGLQKKSVDGQLGDPYEQEADRVTAQVMHFSGSVHQIADSDQRKPIPIQGNPSHSLQKQVIPMESAEEMWNRFVQLRYAGRNDEAMQLVPSLLDVLVVYREEDLESRTLDIASWSLEIGNWELAQRALKHIEDFWWIDYVTNTLGRSAFIGDPSHQLLEHARLEASENRHEIARRLFGLAYLYTQMQLNLKSIDREKHLTDLEVQFSSSGSSEARLQAGSDMSKITRVFSQVELQKGLNTIREIVGYYPGLQRRALQQGDQAAAARYATLGQQLRTDLEQKYILSGSSVITMESAREWNSQRQLGYEITGTNDITEVVTPLPGTRTPQEMGMFPSYTSTMEELLGRIGGQEEFITGLYEYAEIRSAFGNRRIDMNQRATRIRVWQIMYRVYQGIQPDPLESLMALVGQYLKSFTRHTEYNIRDFGVSYLDSEMPTDMAGRAVRDCGVYALTVAYEVYRATREGSPRPRVEFQLWSMPEHVTLVIKNHELDNHFIVNNNEVSESKLGTSEESILKSVARAYAATFKRGFAISPAMMATLGSTAMTDRAFRGQAWSHYLASTQWGFRPEPPIDQDDTRSESQRGQDAYRHYYENINLFDQAAQIVQNSLNTLSKQVISARTPADQLTLLRSSLHDLTQPGNSLANVFIAYGPGVGPRLAIENAQARTMLNNGRSFYLYSLPDTQSHPLVRLGKAILLYQHLGGTLDTSQQELLLKLGGITNFSAEVGRYQNAGYPSGF